MTSSLPSGQTSVLLQMTQRLALSDAHFRRICQLIYQRAGIVLADHKRDMVYNRLVRRLRTLGLDDFGRYLSMLEANQNSAEWQAFINALTTNLTAFFREAHHFPILAEHARRRHGEYRVWSAAASTGEEPYSIAITLAKCQDESGLWHTLLDDPHSYLEASATAGFAYGILKAVRKRYVGRHYAQVAEKAIRGIVKHISPEGELLQTSFGTGMGHDLDFYRHIPLTSMPYGQAMAMLCLTEYLRNYF